MTIAILQANELRVGDTVQPFWPKAIGRWEIVCIELDVEPGFIWVNFSNMQYARLATHESVELLEMAEVA